MADSDHKAKIVTRIWQSIAQSGVQLSSIPKEQLDTLVAAIADGVLVALDDLLQDVGLPQRPARGVAAARGTTTLEKEIVLWRGRPFLSLVENYQVTNERVVVEKGLFSRDFEDVELVRLQDIDFTQSFGGRIIDRGTITLRSADASDPVIHLRKVGRPHQVHEIIRRAMLDARQRYRFSFQEEMTTRRG